MARGRKKMMGREMEMEMRTETKRQTKTAPPLIKIIIIQTTTTM